MPSTSPSPRSARTAHPCRPRCGSRRKGVIDALEEAGLTVDYLEIDSATNADASAGTPTFTGTAVVVRDDAGQASARAAVEKKYGLLAKGFALASLVGKVIPALRPAPRAAIIVTLD